MPLNPSYDDMLRQLAALDGPSLAEVPVEVGREMFRAMQAQAPELEVAAVTDITAGGVPARVYRPPRRRPVSGGHDVPRRRLGDRRP